MKTNVLLENKKNQELNIVLILNEQMAKEEKYIRTAKEILFSNNLEFTPTLFERIEYPGTLEEKVNYAINKKINDGYNYILAIENNEVVGFTEFVKGEFLYKGKLMDSLNVGMSAVHKKHHGRGIAKLLYTFLDSLVHDFGAEIVVRKTWSTNYKQLRLYEKFGYIEADRVKNLRGEGIDSISFCKIFKAF